MTNWTEEEWVDKLAENPDLAERNKAPVIARFDGKVASKAQLPTQQRKNKYHATRTEYNGIWYQSKKEARSARDLDLLQKAGEFDFYLRQVNFPLGGDPPVYYRADYVTFKYFATGYGKRSKIIPGFWDIKVIEPKGFETDVWKMKRKLFREKYPNLNLEVI